MSYRLERLRRLDTVLPKAEGLRQNNTEYPLWSLYGSKGYQTGRSRR